ncbi:hypothetical protein [Lonepinella sp. MS14435]|uniref:hypothetical protein n=1 Tax=Lonepinella sp. MS14435 TaxID=3003618 RepID=UPI0036D893C9
MMKIDNELKREILSTLKKVEQTQLNLNIIPLIMNELVLVADNDKSRYADCLSYINCLASLTDPIGAELSDNICWLNEKITVLLKGGEND